MTTIEKLDYKILIDASGLEKGALKSRKQMKAVERENWKAMSSYQRLQLKIDELDQTFAQGGLSVAVYEKNMAKLKSELAEAGKETSKSSKLFKKFGLDIDSVGAKISAIGIGGTIGGIVAVDRHLVGVIDRVGESITMFERFGLSAPHSLKTYKEAARLAGVDVERLVDANKDLTIKINEAAMAGSGDYWLQFERLGLSVRELVKLEPAEQFREVGKALQLMVDAGQSSKAMTIVDILTGDAGTEGLKGWLYIAKTFPQAIDNSAARLKSAAASIKEMRASYDEAEAEFAMAYAPAVEARMRILAKTLKGETSFDDLRLWGHAASDALGFYGGKVLGRKGETGELAESLGIKLKTRLTTEAEREKATAATIARQQKARLKPSDDAKMAAIEAAAKSPAIKALLKRMQGDPIEKKAAAAAKKTKAVPTAGMMSKARSLHNWLQESTGSRTTSEIRGPGSSIAAGSSAAFNITHQKSVRVQDRAQKTRQQQLDELKKNTTAVEKLAQEMADKNVTAADFGRDRGWRP